MHNDLLKLKLPGFYVEGIELQTHRADIHAYSTATTANCPFCRSPASRVHSHYRRHPQDLPWCGLQVQFHLTVPRFFCDNDQCEHRTFVQRLPELVPLHAQKMARLTETMTLLALGMGGELGCRILGRIGILTSADTLLRFIRQCWVPEYTTPRVLGVDDWSFRKGQVYGTILCDLEKHQAIDLLPDREVETLAQWLRQHPGVEIVTRDRSPTYAEGIATGAPHAIQIADRWHLLKNLREGVQAQLEFDYRQFEWEIPPKTPPGAQGSLDFFERTTARQVRLKNRQARQEKYHQVIELHHQGVKAHIIAQTVGVSTRTISRFLRAGTYPERRRRRPSKTTIDPFADYLLERWALGCTNRMQLWREISDQGYSGSYATVANHFRRLKAGLPFLRQGTTSSPLRPKDHVTPYQAAWLFVLSKDELSEVQKGYLHKILEHYPDVQLLYKLTSEFCQMLREKSGAQLQNWLIRVEASPFAALHSFVNGIRNDQAAVQAAFMFEWSNGQVEGQVNRLKLIKRYMYGRANFDLLRQRVIMKV